MTSPGIEYEDLQRLLANPGEATGHRSDGSVGGILVPTGSAASMSPAEVVTDEDAQAALSATFAPVRPTELVFSPAEMSFVRDGATFGTYPSGSGTRSITSWALPHDQTLPAVSITARVPHGWSNGFRVGLWWANATTESGQVNFDVRAHGFDVGDNLGADLVGGGLAPWEGTVTAGAQNTLQYLALSLVFSEGMAPGRLFTVRIARRPSVEVGGLPAAAHVLGVRLTPVEP